ncbi:hypothetical protein BDZ97DRAFT_1020588 [Flammula alnicola]|nr:hypothetical protein BDZ97DRAFT_1020588 [Flammula alnicola]
MPAPTPFKLPIVLTCVMFTATSPAFRKLCGAHPTPLCVAETLLADLDTVFCHMHPKCNESKGVCAPINYRSVTVPNSSLPIGLSQRLWHNLSHIQFAKSIHAAIEDHITSHRNYLLEPEPVIYFLGLSPSSTFHVPYGCLPSLTEGRRLTPYIALLLPSSHPL